MAEKALIAPHQDLKPSDRWGRPYAAALIRWAEAPGGVALVAEVDGTFAGFIFAAPDRLSTWELRSVTFSRSCAILDLYVLPRFRRIGLAGRLMAGVERRFALRGYHWMRTFYYEGHQLEARLYRGRGFAVNVVGVAKRLRKGNIR